MQTTFPFSFKCHEQDGEMYFLSLAHDRITLSSYHDERIRKRVERWVESVPDLA